MAFLKICNLSVAFATSPILCDLTSDIEKGQFVALVGPNGAGKTTLLRALSGLIPYQGQITLGGCDLADMTINEKALKLSYLAQGHQVHWPMSVKAIVALGRLSHRHASPRIKIKPGGFQDNHEDKVLQALRATELEELSERPIDQLSGGEVARVMVARALASEAPLLLADEPTASLDPYHKLQVLDLLKAQSRRGITIIVVLHDLPLAAQFSDKVMLLSNGRLIGDGPAQNVLTVEQIAKVYRVTYHSEDGRPRPLIGAHWQRVPETLR